MKKALAVFILALGLMIGAYFSFSKLSLDTSVDEIMGTDHRSRASYEKMDEAFKDRTVVLALCRIDNLFSNSGVKKLFEISERLESMPELNDIRSLTHAARPVKRGNHFDVRKNIKLENFLDLNERNHDEWLKIKSFITNYPMTRDLLISSDGKYTIIIARLAKEHQSILEKINLHERLHIEVQDFKEQGIDIKFLSEPVLSAEFYKLSRDFAVKLILLTLIFVPVILYLSFKSFKIVFYMVAYEFAGLMIFPIVFTLNNLDLNVYTCVLIPLILSLQLTFLVHFFSVYQQSKGRTQNPWSFALRRVFKPSLIALMTSLIGFGSLYFAEVKILKDLGSLGVQCLLAVFAVSFIPPVIFSKCSKEEEEAHSLWDEKEHQEHVLNSFIKKQKTLISITFVALMLVGAIVYPSIKTDMRAREFLTPESETRQSLEWVNSHFGGLNIFQLKVIASERGGIQKYENLKFLHDLRNKAESMAGVKNAYTYSQFYTTIHQLFLGDSLSHGNVFPPKEAVFTYNLIINSQAFPFKDVLQNKDLNETLFLLRTDDITSDEFIKIAEEFAIIAKQDLPQGLRIEIPDGLQSILKSDRDILQSQMKSVILSLVSILILLLILWRSTTLAIPAFLTAASAIFSLVLVMNLTNVTLNSITVMSAAIILGIVIDDAIHFLSYYRHSRSQGHSHQSALGNCFKSKLRPMICTSLILSGCFGLFCFSPFPPMREFGLSGALALICGLAASCLFLPALLSLGSKK